MTGPDPASTIPDYQSLMLPVLRSAESGAPWLGDVVRRLADELVLSEEACASLLPSGR